MNTQSEPSRESSEYFIVRRSDGSDSRGWSWNQPASSKVMCVDDVRIVPRRSTSANASLTAGEDWQHEPVVGRLITCLPKSPDRTLAESRRPTELLTDAFVKWAAEKLKVPTWPRSGEFWVTPMSDRIEAVAEGLGRFQHKSHELVLGKPVSFASPQIELGDQLGDVLAGIATELPRPGDTSIKGIKRIVQFTGIAVGVACGHPLLVNPCLKSLLHDILVEEVSNAIGKIISNTLLQPQLGNPEDVPVEELPPIDRAIGPPAGSHSKKL